MRANPVKQALKAGKPSVGTWLSLGSITASRFLARCGFAWLTIVPRMQGAFGDGRDLAGGRDLEVGWIILACDAAFGHRDFAGVEYLGQLHGRVNGRTGRWFCCRHRGWSVLHTRLFTGRLLLGGGFAAAVESTTGVSRMTGFKTAASPSPNATAAAPDMVAMGTEVSDEAGFFSERLRRDFGMS